MNLLLVRIIDICIGIPLVYLIFITKKVFSRKRHSGDIADCNKILIIKLWGIGNTALLLPSMRGLRKKFPSARIDYLTQATNRGIAGMSGAFGNIYCISITSFFGFIKSTLENIIKLKREDYDLVIDCEQFARFSTILTALISGKKTIGFETKNQHRHLLYELPVRYNNEIHMSDSFYSCVERAGVRSKKTLDSDFLFCRNEDTKKPRNLLKSKIDSAHHVSILIHVGTSVNFTPRRWPISYIVELAEKLIEKFPVILVLTGSSEEKEAADEVFGRIKNKKYVINAAGALSFEEFAALIKESDLVVSCDTSTVHIASCFSVPTIGLYGPNTPRLYGPWGRGGISVYKALDCSPCITNYNAKIAICRHREGKGNCMKKISPDEVFEAIRKNFFNDNAPFRLEKISAQCKK